MLAMAITAMSVLDLHLTLLYVTNTGMAEANPLARAMMEYGSPAVLALWKLATVTLCLGILVAIRKRVSAEIGAWVGFLILSGLMAHWVNFIYETRYINLQVVEEIASIDSSWVMMEEPGRVVID